jgi:hypothetical protein
MRVGLYLRSNLIVKEGMGRLDNPYKNTLSEPLYIENYLVSFKIDDMLKKNYLLPTKSY